MDFGCINFCSNLMGMQATANIADAQMGMVGISMEKDKLFNQIGQMPVQDLFEREKALDLEMAKLDTYEKMNVQNEKAAKKKKH